ncbi:alpha-amylase family protein [Sinisalibacter aestuarii]|uniref:Alpha-amylase n=1 Tax=Sinisalibacter aestuarii TaxID=2949426 RepID=A0ABQ5LNK4_9RHOB|nr:alpha-amylase family protein [Sinisalibacter aestuarii]GKY86565.1 alpha-amylase [Sinisalibacter aestuarii]
MSKPRSFNDRLFALRLERSRGDLFGMLERLYGHRPDFARFRDELTEVLKAAWDERPDRLKWRDMQRDLEPDWFQRPGMNGYVFYIDRFAGNLAGVAEKLDYLQDLGITYVHFMPCLKPRPGDSDGGYSVMDYTEVNPALGTMDELEAVTAACHERGISVCIDLVLNHTAKEHDWAQKAQAGDERYRDYYLMFVDDSLPKAYETSLIEIFPANAPGNFTYYEDIDRWVWTTFNEHQWDLNWANPRVFLEMVQAMLYLANKGLDVLRLDAPAFLWKRMGTRCQSEPEVHMLLHALRAASRIAAPSVIHLEEAIVSPAEMLPYLGRGEHDGKEGNLAYHNSLMVQFWSALAARDTRLMTHVLRTHFPPSVTNATYANYLRCHDDIGWAVTDDDAGAVGVSGFGHRAFLSDFYEGGFRGSFARGALFQVNEATGDKRISGTTASLAGLEQALEEGDAALIDHAVDRILMGHALIASYGGIPLLYMGDELALLNDYSYTQVPEHAHDSRWVHRPRMDWTRAARLPDGGATPEGRVFDGIRHILARRSGIAGFHGAVATEMLDAGQAGLFAFARRAPTGPVVCVFNFTETWLGLPASWFRAQGATKLHDLLSDAPVIGPDGGIGLPPYARIWVV